MLLALSFQYACFPSFLVATFFSIVLRFEMAKIVNKSVYSESSKRVIVIEQRKF